MSRSERVASWRVFLALQKPVCASPSFGDVGVHRGESPGPAALHITRLTDTTKPREAPLRGPGRCGSASGPRARNGFSAGRRLDAAEGTSRIDSSPRVELIFRPGPDGEVSEWLKVHAWKACVR